MPANEALTRPWRQAACTVWSGSGWETRSARVGQNCAERARLKPA